MELSQAKPEKYNGDPARCRGFLLQGQLYIDAIRCQSDYNKLTWLLGFLTGKAILWAMAVWEQGGNAISAYENFVTLIKQVFDYAPEGREVSSRISSLKQGQHHVVEYTLEFRILVADSGWNEAALVLVYRQGLNSDFIVELACRDDVASLDTLVDLSVKLDNLLQDHCAHLRLPISQPVKRTPRTIPIQHLCLDNTERE